MSDSVGVGAIGTAEGITASLQLGEGGKEKAIAVAGRHVPVLDGMRAFAILGVMAVHAGVPGCQSGWLGVDLFFAISGFLITTLLLSEFQKSGAISLGNFWARRFLRLMPAYYLYAICITLAIWYWPGSVVQEHAGWTPAGFTAALWLYAMNYFPMGGIWNGQEVTIHLWSLAVEEQYYLFWPAFLCLLLHFRRFMLPTAWLLYAAVLTYCLFGANEHERSAMLYARGMSLFLASAAAITLFEFSSSGRLTSYLRSVRPERLLMLALLGTAAAFAVAAAKLMTEHEVRFALLPFLIFLYVATIAALWYAPVSGIWKTVLSHPALVYIGKISYGVYLYHEVVRVFIWWATESWFSGLPKFVAYGIKLGLYGALSLALASLSFYFFERRFLNLKDRFR